MNMKENEGINGLFRSRLEQSEMSVRQDFWAELQRDLTVVESGVGKRFWLSPTVSRVAVAASVALVLGAASAVYWFLASPEVREQAFAPTSAYIPETVWKGKDAEETFSEALPENSTTVSSIPPKSVKNTSAVATSTTDSPTMSVHFSITVSQQTYGKHNDNKRPRGYVQTAGERIPTLHREKETAFVPDRENSDKVSDSSPLKSRKWAIKPYLGTSLPKGDFRMPFTTGVLIERKLNKRLALEAGLQYNLLHDVSAEDGEHTLHSLAIPVRLNVMLAGNNKMDFYATAGGAVEKCVAGTDDNRFSADPMQLSVTVGLGVRYKLNDRIALFAEPTVSHHFDTDSPTRSLRTERPTNLNVLCGVRMVY